MSEESKKLYFFFNGVELSHYGNWWNMVNLSNLEESGSSSEEDLLSEVYSISCRIDHVDTIESSGAELFVYAVNEVLFRALNRSNIVVEEFQSIIGEPEGIRAFGEFVEALFMMRKLVQQFSCAFWTSSENVGVLPKLLEAIRRSKLYVEQVGYEKPPHIRAQIERIVLFQTMQLRKLHGLAHSGRFDKEIRSKLAELR